MNAENVKEIQTWLRGAVAVFDKVTATENRLKTLGDENARAEMKAKDLRAETETLEKEKAVLERMVEALKDGGKTPSSPLTELEWSLLLRDTGQGFGGVRDFILKLADFFGAK